MVTKKAAFGNQFSLPIRQPRVACAEIMLKMLKKGRSTYFDSKNGTCENKSRLAGVEGIEPSAYGFGDRRSTS